MSENGTINLPLIGVSENIRKIDSLIRDVAHTGLNVVITGETGVGKEVVARNLYHSSPRFGNPFIKINCAAVPDTLLESEMFGFERGAFTGADRKKKGKFELSQLGHAQLYINYRDFPYIYIFLKQKKGTIVLTRDNPKKAQQLYDDIKKHWYNYVDTKVLDELKKKYNRK